MGFDPAIHHRRSIRLQDYDYAQAGAYFVTLCTQGRECTLGQIDSGISRLSPVGEAVQQHWQDLPKRFNNISLGAYIIMPNHLHGIITIHPVGALLAAPLVYTPESSVGAPLAAPLMDAAPSKSSGPDRFTAKQGATKQGAASSAPTLGGILRAFKSLSAIAANRLLERTGQPFWQRNYWEHVVRSETELHAICEYMHNNPKQWELDSLYVEASA